MPLKVMVIDDSELVLSVVSEFLQSAGHQVVTRAISVGTRAAVLRQQPDVVVLDVNMPLLDGNEVCASIRGHQSLRGTRVILHSDRPEAELRQLTADCRANGYICKTSDRGRFLREFDRLCRPARTVARPPQQAASYILAACTHPTQDRLRDGLVSAVPVVYTASGLEALRYIEERPPAALLLGTRLTEVPWTSIREQVVAASVVPHIVVIRESDVWILPDIVTWDPARSLAELEANLVRMRNN